MKKEIPKKEQSIDDFIKNWIPKQSEKTQKILYGYMAKTPRYKQYLKLIPETKDNVMENTRNSQQDICI